MTYKKVEAFKTKDGKVFEHEIKAYKHNNYLDLKEDYYESSMSGQKNRNGEVAFDDVIEWVEENEELVLKILAMLKGR